jgi:hypothetical protein
MKTRIKRQLHPNEEREKRKRRKPNSRVTEHHTSAHFHPTHPTHTPNIFQNIRTQFLPIAENDEPVFLGCFGELVGELGLALAFLCVRQEAEVSLIWMASLRYRGTDCERVIKRKEYYVLWKITFVPQTPFDPISEAGINGRSIALPSPWKDLASGNSLAICPASL